MKRKNELKEKNVLEQRDRLKQRNANILRDGKMLRPEMKQRNEKLFRNGPKKKNELKQKRELKQREVNIIRNGKLLRVGMLMLLIVSACGLFKNTSSKLDKERLELEAEHHLEATFERNNEEKASSVLTYRDSSRSDYLIQLWPRGVFTWDAEKGFTGEADKVLISGTQEQGTAGLRKEKTVKNKKEQLQLEWAGSSSLKQEAKHKEGSSKVSWKTTLPLLVLVFAVVGVIIWFIIQKIKR